MGLNDAASATKAYRLGLVHEPTSAMLQQGLDDATKLLGTAA